MAWLPVQRGLAVPPQYGPIDPASPLSADLCSLWVPALGQSGVGLINLAQNYQAPMVHGTGTTMPTMGVTEFGAGQRYDGQNDISLKPLIVPFSPHLLIQNTLAVVCRVDVMPSSPNYGVVYNFNNGTNIDGRAQIDIKSDRVRFWFSGNNGTNANYAEVTGVFTPGEVMFITACADSYTTTRISVWEPRTGRFFTNTNTAGTNTQASLSAFPIENESLGGRYYNGYSDVFLGVTILDAWAWRRSLTDDHLEMWRNNRWSVFQSNRAKTALIYNQRANMPGTQFSTNINYIYGSATVTKSPIVLGKTFVAISSFIPATVGTVKSASPSGVIFVNSSSLSFGAPASLREDFSSILREDGGNQLKEASQPVVGEKYDVAISPFIVQASLLAGAAASVQSTTPSGVYFYKNILFFPGNSGAQITTNVAGVTLVSSVSLSFGGQAFYREDNGFLLREDGSVFQKETQQTTSSQFAASATGSLFVSSVALINGSIQGQRNPSVMGQMLKQDSIILTGDLAKSVPVSGAILSGSVSLITGNQAGQISRSIPGQVLGSSVILFRQVDVPGKVLQNNGSLVSGTVLGRRVANAAGVVQQIQASFFAGSAGAKINGLAVGQTIVKTTSFAPGASGSQKQAQTPSQQFLAVQRLFSGSIQTTSVVSVPGITLSRSATLLAGQGRGITQAKIDRKILARNIVLIRGAARGSKSSSTTGKNFLASVIFTAGKTAGGSVKPPTGQVKVGLQVRSVSGVKLEAK